MRGDVINISKREYSIKYSFRIDKFYSFTDFEF